MWLRLTTHSGTPEVVDRRACYKKSHSLRVFRSIDGGYIVTCGKCGLWTIVPGGERLKGWIEDANVVLAAA